MTRVRIGTRGSHLALWQANETARLLREGGHEPEIVTIKTTGDKRQNVPLATIGGKGLFIKELEDALDKRRIDVAVHSLKDVPSIIPERFRLAAFLERADPRDAWIHPNHVKIEDMPDGSLIGTSAPRRAAQLRARWPSLRIGAIRGNVDSRIHKVRQGQYAAAILAAAGLTRLGRQEEITSYFETDEMLPAAGQGIVALEVLTDEAHAIAATIDHAPSAMAARCERGVLQKFGDRLDCYSAIAVHATIGHGSVTIRAFLADHEGTRSIRATSSGSYIDGAIDDVARQLMEQGAEELLRAQL